MKRNNLFILVAVFAIAAFVVLNILAARNTPKSHEEVEAEEQKQQQEAQAKAKGEKTDTATPEGGDVAEATNFLLEQGDNKYFGSPQASRVLTIGWGWTPTVQGNPTGIRGEIKNILTTAGKGYTVHLVNTDNHPEVPTGATIGKTTMPLAPDGTIDQNVSRGIQAMAMQMMRDDPNNPNQSGPRKPVLMPPGP